MKIIFNAIHFPEIHTVMYISKQYIANQMFNFYIESIR